MSISTKLRLFQAYYDNSKLKSNMVRKTKKNNESDGTYLPFISSEYANQEDRKRNPDEQYYKYERNLDRVGQDQSSFYRVKRFLT